MRNSRTRPSARPRETREGPGSPASSPRLASPRLASAMSPDSPSRTRTRAVSAPTKPHKPPPTSAAARGSPPRLARRDQTCGDGHHNCLDINQPDRCCSNQNYCYVNAAGEARCCPVGSNCVADSPCKSEFYFCTTTLSGLAAANAANAANATTQGCCGRKCPQTSYYLCPSSLGGKCCPYDADCQADGNCVMKRAAPSTTTPTGPDAMSVVELGGLSPGAKAGVGVGVALGTSLLIALAAWSFALCRRRRARRANAARDSVANRAEMTGSLARAPAVEMAEDEPEPDAAGPGPERPHVESFDGPFELDASSQAHAPESDPGPGSGPGAYLSRPGKV
ncbi:uncharacterized protein MAM_05603 [Metarhizium album ARSEF 1941]|uniref:Uncharacterized protein n=1 Tax=Metarhizium album (strain ARSEF 1941) TaxID=1081103 RepID=A0A0B2WUM3_METAS|nr:uncharacterized protein MAM_05603 [Metarhizium album ARSEF 1941]KHN96660.1 hypothetical protein MAM_05603 [Metarhizium album ARSEF 1941]